MPTRILLCGASSVGKTTLATDWCSRHPNFKHIQEVARTIMEKRSITREDLTSSLSGDKKLFLDLQYWIFEEQNELERQHIQNGHSFISDRGPDPLAFASFYADSAAVEKLASTPSAISCLERYRDCLIVILSPLEKCSDDGVRLMSTEYRDRILFTECLCSLLRNYGLPYVYCSVTDRYERLYFLEQVAKRKYPLSVVGNRDPLFNNIPFLSKKPSKPAPCYIQAIVITEESITTSYQRQEGNRMMSRYNSDQFVTVAFDRFLKPELIISFLSNGVRINGEEHHFLGCSTGGLKERTCFLLKGPASHVKEVLQECGSFVDIKSPSKMLKRIGLLFSKCQQTHVTPADVSYEPDIETATGNFTDGCGRIGLQLASDIVARSNLPLDDGYIPSVFQIRFEGCKGVLAVDPELKPTSIRIRHSMRKFEMGCKPFKDIWLCDHSRPYSYGHLNRQFITLLSALGVKDEVFRQLQRDHFECLQLMTQDAEVAVQISHWKARPDLAVKIAATRNLQEDKYIQRELTHIKSRLIDKMDKLSILVHESRNVFGVCDTHGVLNYGECFFRPTISGTPKTLQGKVVVCKNPCYLLGDVRVLTAVSDPRVKKLEHLTDCIVFPTTGDRPHPAEIAGSDLDGDQFFVSWQNDLVPERLHPPYSYPSSETPPTEVTSRDLLTFFANFKSDVGKIDGYYKYWAELEGVSSSECQQLGELFAKSVDASKTGATCRVPKHLIPPRKHSSMINRGRIWNQLLLLAGQKKKELKSKMIAGDSIIPAIAEDFVNNIIHDDLTDVTDYRLFHFAHTWCNGQGYTEEEALRQLCNLSNGIHFGHFSLDQQVEAIDCGIPTPLITNALNKSKLLTPEMLQPFLLHSPHCHWRFYLSTNQVDFEWVHMLRALERYPESFVVLQLQNGVCVVLHFLNSLSSGERKKFTAGSASAYIFSGKFAYHDRHVLGQEYSYDLSNDLFQIYRGERNRSFLWLGHPKPKKHKDLDSEDEFTCVSIDLTRFRGDILRTRQHPTINKQVFTSMEIFVQTRRNEPAYFDLWYANEPNQALPLTVTDPKTIEEIPVNSSDSQHAPLEHIITAESYTFQHAIASLGESAGKGDCQVFCDILTVLTQNEGGKLSDSKFCNPVWQSFQSLLDSLLVRYARRDMPQSSYQLLLEITSRPYLCIDISVRFLQIISAVTRMYSGSVDNLTHRLLKFMQLSSVSQYLEIAMNWKCWFYLSPDVSTQLTSYLTSRAASLFDSQHSHLSQAESLKGCENTTEIAVLGRCLEQYVCHLATLVFQEFIDQMLTLKDQIATTANSIQLLKAYRLKEPRIGLPNDLEDISEMDSRKAKWQIGFHGPEDAVCETFHPGMWVSLHPMLIGGNTSAHPVAVGCIIHVTNNPVNIEVDIAEPVPVCLKNSATAGEGHWILKQIGDVVTFMRTMSVLKSLLKKKVTGLLQILLCTHRVFSKNNSTGLPDDLNKDCQPPERVADLSTQLEKRGLNPSQQLAVQGALTEKVTLIQGPPGSGKTYIACEIVAILCQWLATDAENRILVTARTNVAVDTLTQRLLDRGIRVIQLGCPENTNSPASLHHHLELKRLESGKNRIPNLVTAQKDILKCAQVVATTCAGAGDPLLKDMAFHCIVIEEAEQVTEPASLIPIVLGCQKLVLIGDPHQPSPCPLIGRRRPAQEITDTRKEPHRSLFHRLQGCISSFVLDEQFRMHPLLASFPSIKFYDGKLKTAESVHQHNPPKVVIFGGDPLVFFDVPDAHEEQIGTSYRNTSEADIVAKIIMHLLNCEISSPEITVLTFYSAQVTCIRKKLDMMADKVGIYTVEGFQGQENEVVIFSCVRNNCSGELGFAGSEYHMNLLLTRAKRLLIGVGSQDTMAKGSKLWFEWLRQKGISFQRLDDLESHGNVHRKKNPAPSLKQSSHKQESHQQRLAPRQQASSQQWKPHQKVSSRERRPQQPRRVTQQTATHQQRLNQQPPTHQQRVLQQPVTHQQRVLQQPAPHQQQVTQHTQPQDQQDKPQSHIRNAKPNK